MIHYQQLKRGSRYLSDIYGEDYGCYYHENLSVYCKGYEATVLEFEFMKQLFASEQTLEKKVDVAMQAAAPFHEMRHFHDCFGTLAGLSLFGGYIRTVGAFRDLARYLYEHKIPWKLPLKQWADESVSPQRVRDFVLQYESLRRYRDVFLGSVLVPGTQGFTDEVWREVRIPELNVSFPAFCASVTVALVTDKSRPHQTIRESKDVTQFYPLGFECLLEGTAQALQRGFLEGMDRLDERLDENYIYLTSENGTITFTTDGERLWVETEE